VEPCPGAGPGGGEGCSRAPPSPDLRPCAQAASLLDRRHGNARHNPTHYAGRLTRTSLVWAFSARFDKRRVKLLLLPGDWLLGRPSLLRPPRPRLACWRAGDRRPCWRGARATNPLRCRGPGSEGQGEPRPGASEAPWGGNR